MPLSAKDIRKILKRITLETRNKVEKELSQVLSFKDVQGEEVIGKLMKRIQELEKMKLAENYNASYHFSKGLIQ